MKYKKVKNIKKLNKKIKKLYTSAQLLKWSPSLSVLSSPLLPSHLLLTCLPFWYQGDWIVVRAVLLRIKSETLDIKHFFPRSLAFLLVCCLLPPSCIACLPLYYAVRVQSIHHITSSHTYISFSPWMWLLFATASRSLLTLMLLIDDRLKLISNLYVARSSSSCFLNALLARSPG